MSGALPPIAETPVQVGKRKRSAVLSEEPDRDEEDGDEPQHTYSRKRRKSGRVTRNATRRGTNGSNGALSTDEPSVIRVAFAGFNEDEGSVNGAGESTDELEHVNGANDDSGDQPNDADVAQADPAKEDDDADGAEAEVDQDTAMPIEDEGTDGDVGADDEDDDAFEDDGGERIEDTQPTESVSNSFADEEPSAIVADEEDQPQDDTESPIRSQTPTQDLLAVADDAVTEEPSADVTPAGTPPDQNVGVAGLLKPVDKRILQLAGTDAAKSEPDKPAKRLPGRRRAPHANPKIEAALRRQLHLRVGYRAVAKALKPILAELASRSATDVKNDPDAHKKVYPYGMVQAGLEKRAAHRQEWIQRLHTLNREKLQHTLDVESEVLRTQHKDRVERLRDDFINQLKHDFLMVMRKQQRKEAGDHASDDEVRFSLLVNNQNPNVTQEDDVISTLRQCSYKGELGPILPKSLYHNRSRPFVETNRLFAELNERCRVFGAERGHDDDMAQAHVEPFTTFDPAHREIVKAQRGLSRLAAAAEVVEAVPPPPPLPPPRPAVTPTIPNHEAIALQVLADASFAPWMNQLVVPKVATTVQPASTAAEVRPVEQARVAVKQQPLSSPPAKPDLHSRRPAYDPVWNLENQRNAANATSQQHHDTQRAARHDPLGSQPLAITVNNSLSGLIAPPQPPLVLQAPHEPQQSITVKEPASSSPAYQLVPLDNHTNPKPAKSDFWSSLARGHQESIASQSGLPGKVKLAPKGIQGSDNDSAGTHGRARAGSSAAAGAAPNLSIQQIHAREGMRRPGPPPILPAEQHAGRFRSSSDSYGDLFERHNGLDTNTHNNNNGATRLKKAPAPKRSIGPGAWPRSRFYDPATAEARRRASTNSVANQPPGLRGPRPQDAISPSFNQAHPYQQQPPQAPAFHGHPPPGYPSAPSPGYPHAPQYQPAPLQPFPYGQSATPYNAPSPYGPPVSPLPGPYQQQHHGYSMPPPQSAYGQHLPGPQQPPYGQQHQSHQPPYMSGAPGPGPGPASGYPPPPGPPQSSAPAYVGPQFGGPPILPAGQAAPAFAQWNAAQSHHERNGRRNQRNSGFGGESGQGQGQGQGQTEFRPYFGPR